MSLCKELKFEWIQKHGSRGLTCSSRPPSTSIFYWSSPAQFLVIMMTMYSCVRNRRQFMQVSKSNNGIWLPTNHKRTHSILMIGIWYYIECMGPKECTQMGLEAWPVLFIHRPELKLGQMHEKSSAAAVSEACVWRLALQPSSTIHLSFPSFVPHQPSPKKCESLWCCRDNTRCAHFLQVYVQAIKSRCHGQHSYCNQWKPICGSCIKSLGNSDCKSMGLEAWSAFFIHHPPL